MPTAELRDLETHASETIRRASGGEAGESRLSGTVSGGGLPAWLAAPHPALSPPRRPSPPLAGCLGNQTPFTSEGLK